MNNKKPNEKPRIVHYSKNKNGHHVLFCRDNEGVWGFETTGLQDRVTCPQCLKLLGRAKEGANGND